MDVNLIYPKIPIENTATIERCEWLVARIFDEIARRHGEEAARKIFKGYGRQLTEHDRTRREDAELLFRYYNMPKRNKLALARALVEEGRKRTVAAAERWIKLITNPKEKRAHAAHRHYELLCIDLEDWAARDAEEMPTSTKN
jgi:hypothetical protein